ncbi:MAG: hypothetical protein IJ149_05310 [Oscillospiraceae bacterium]|nr:hypothetical protein [Oscillospiraceae bacterium]
MKTQIKTVIALAASLLLLSGCTPGQRRAAENVMDHLTPPPKDWYAETVNYYIYGAQTGWRDESLYGDLSQEIKDPENHAGYCLADLNGDGTDELLIGFNDGDDITRFLEIYIYHPDLGDHVYRSFNAAGEGYYIYLCEGNVVRLDWEYPGRDEPQSDYMKLNKDVTSGWPIQQYDSDPPKPQKCDVITFESFAETAGSDS